MTRVSVFVIVMFTAGLVTLSWIDEPEKTDEASAAVTQFDEQTMEMVVHYESFKSTLDSALADLEGRRINLSEATIRVYGAAKLHSPVYLDRIRHSDGGKTSEERVARNLIGHLRSFEEMKPRLRDRIEELDSELTALLGGIDDGGGRIED